VANEVARKLRKIMTRREVKLRALREIGHHFRRQSPIAEYVVDFECRRLRLIIEVDGNQHGFDEHRRRDEVRDKVLQNLGYRILRFANYEVDREFDGVLEADSSPKQERRCRAKRARRQDERTCAFGIPFLAKTAILMYRTLRIALRTI
jgi:very-short-patch-repair endonuclease